MSGLPRVRTILIDVTREQAACRDGSYGRRYPCHLLGEAKAPSQDLSFSQFPKNGPSDKTDHVF